MNAALVMFKVDGTRREFPIFKERIVVGRTNTCDLRIPISSVSRQHCEIRVQDNKVRIRDLGSSNGTYRNNNRIQEAILEAGDEIHIGPVVFTVVIDGKPTKISGKAHPAHDSVAAGNPPAPEPGIPAPEPVHNLGQSENYTPTVDLDEPIDALEAMLDEADPQDVIPVDDDEDQTKP